MLEVLENRIVTLTNFISIHKNCEEIQELCSVVAKRNDLSKDTNEIHSSDDLSFNLV